MAAWDTEERAAVEAQTRARAAEGNTSAKAAERGVETRGVITDRGVGGQRLLSRRSLPRPVPKIAREDLALVLPILSLRLLITPPALMVIRTVIPKMAKSSTGSVSVLYLGERRIERGGGGGEGGI